MEKLLSSIDTRLAYIKNNSTNAFILKEDNIIGIKMEDFKNKVFKTQELVNEVCDKIINYDIAMMKNVAGETNMVYKKMDELAGFVEELKTAYFA